MSLRPGGTSLNEHERVEEVMKCCYACSLYFPSLTLRATVCRIGQQFVGQALGLPSCVTEKKQGGMILNERMLVRGVVRSCYACYTSLR